MNIAIVQTTIAKLDQLNKEKKFSSLCNSFLFNYQHPMKCSFGGLFQHTSFQVANLDVKARLDGITQVSSEQTVKLS